MTLRSLVIVTLSRRRGTLSLSLMGELVLLRIALPALYRNVMLGIIINSSSTTTQARILLISITTAMGTRLTITIIRLKIRLRLTFVRLRSLLRPRRRRPRPATINTTA